MGKLLTSKQEKLLNKIYYDPSKPGSFAAVDKLYRSVKEIDPSLTRYKVSVWLQKQDAYTLHKQNRIKFKRRKVEVEGIDHMWASDLIQMPNDYTKFNDGFKYLIVCLDIFSKFSWVLPLKTKKTNEVKNAFEQIFKDRKPLRILTDSGGEYTSKSMKLFFEENNVTHIISRNTETKSSYAERYIKFFKSRIFRYLTANNTYRYIDVVQKLVDSYNSMYHRTIKEIPKNVNKTNEQIIFENMYVKKIDNNSTSKTNDAVKNENDETTNKNDDTTKNNDKKSDNLSKQKRLVKSKSIYKYKLGDTVRISHIRNPFYSGYKQTFSSELFKVIGRTKSDPPTYKLEDQLGTKIEGSFYASELTKTFPSKKNKEYKIEKIISSKIIRKKKYFLVKWLNYDSRYNSYIPAKDIKTLK